MQKYPFTYGIFTVSHRILFVLVLRWRRRRRRQLPRGRIAAEVATYKLKANLTQVSRSTVNV
jgi:hypothetical protein